MTGKKRIPRTTEVFQSVRDVVSLVACIDGLHKPVNEDETKFVGLSVTSRKREFAAGRNIARECLARFGRGEAAIPVSESRAPVWPKGLTGSISHSGHIAGAAACLVSDYKAVGLDIEEHKAVTADLFDSILTTDDLAHAEEDMCSSLATRVFCCKEAIYKAVNPVIGEYLDFSDVSVRISGGRFSAQCGSGKLSSELIATGWGFLETDNNFVKALFLIK